MKIGLLLPRSVLYPSMGFDIVDGLKASLKHHGFADFSLITQNIGVAAKDEDVYARCEQLLMEDADIVIAYVNPVTAEYLHPLFTASNKLLLVLDSGFHFPSPLTILSNAIFVSLQGGLCCRVSGRLASMEEQPSMAYTCSFYDAGYRSSYNFYNGLVENGGNIVFNHVTDLKRQNFTIQTLYDNMESKQIKGILASFCGDMAEDFFREGAVLGLFEKYRIFGSPYMAEELWLDKIPYPGGDFTAVVPWGRGLDNEMNKSFMEVLNKPGKANIFSLIAWDAGTIVSELKDMDEVGLMKEAIAKAQMNSPRGDLKYNQATGQIEAPVYAGLVVKNNDTGNCSLVIKEVISFVEEDRKKLQQDIDTFEETANSWFNAYPCLES